MFKVPERPNTRHAPIIAVIVSRDRHDELNKTISAVLSQEIDAKLSILIVDSSISPIPEEITSCYKNLVVIRSAVNLGGAGGFALGILNAIAAGADWLWLMDDDGRPVNDGVLSKLLCEAETDNLDAIAPVVLDVGDLSRFAFPYPVKRHYVFKPDEMSSDTTMPSMAHLFNGLLIRATSIFKVGLPDLRLFIRGDEIDYLHRMRRAKLRFGTTTNAAFVHPSSNHELLPIWGGRLHVVYPQAGWKRRNQYRNRGYNFLRDRQFLTIAVDFVRYPYFFLIIRGFDFVGLSEWIKCMWSGMLGHVYIDPVIDLKPRSVVRSVL